MGAATKGEEKTSHPSRGLKEEGSILSSSTNRKHRGPAYRVKGGSTAHLIPLLGRAVKGKKGTGASIRAVIGSIGYGSSRLKETDCRIVYFLCATRVLGEKSEGVSRSGPALLFDRRPGEPGVVLEWRGRKKGERPLSFYLTTVLGWKKMVDIRLKLPPTRLSVGNLTTPPSKQKKRGKKKGLSFFSYPRLPEKKGAHVGHIYFTACVNSKTRKNLTRDRKKKVSDLGSPFPL